MTAAVDLLQALAGRAAERRTDGDPAGAARDYRAALAIDPALGDLWFDFAAVAADPLPALDRAVGLNPRDVDALARRGRRGDLRRALALDPASAEALNRRGLQVLPIAPAAAAALFARVARLRPGDAAPRYNLGLAQRRLGAVDAAQASFRAALALDPAFLAPWFQRLDLFWQSCRWEDAAAMIAVLSDRLDVALAISGPAAAIGMAFTLPYIAERHPAHRRLLCALGDRYAAAARPAVRAPRRPGRLRVGYLSADFGDRPMSHVLAPVLEAHDRARHEIHLLSLRDRAAEATSAPWIARLKDAADGWQDLSALDDAAAVAAIAACDLDLLIDLAGYMDGCRPAVLAARPARRQAHWLGAGGGLGAPYVDYLIADAITVPPGDQGHYRETVIRLDPVYHPAGPQAVASTPPRHALGLPEGAVVLANFNNPLKFDPASFDLWLALLRDHPAAVLWLSERGPHRDTIARLRDRAARAGLDPARLVGAPGLPDRAAHLGRLAAADLVVDCLHYSGATTTLDALWVGVPVLTRYGGDFHGRIGASLLNAAGLPELIATATADYADRARRLIADGDLRGRIRAKLALHRDRAVLFDPARLTRGLEAAFAAMTARDMTPR